MVNVGMIERTRNGFAPGTVRLHLPHDSHLIYKHHINWRMQAMKAIDNKREANLHYSSVVSISTGDFHVIRDLLLKAIDQAKEKIRASKEETLASFCLDFFELGSGEGSGN